MIEFIKDLFSVEDFNSRWSCGKWSSAHGWTHILSDLAIFGAYFAIPAIIAYYVFRKKEVVFPAIFWLFASFILFCGLGHLIEATLFWHPWYRFAALIKVCVALVSWATVFVLLPIIPRALSSPGLIKLSERLKLEKEGRQRSDEALAQSELKYQDLYDNAPEMFLLVDTSGFAVRQCNQTFAWLMEYSKQEIIGKPAFYFFHPTYRESLRKALEAFCQAGEVKDQELALETRSGNRIEVSFKAGSIRDASGKLIAGQCSMRDIRDRVRSEKLIPLMVEAAPSAMVAVRQDGTIAMVNAQTEKVFGFPRHEILDRPIEMLVPERFRSGHMADRRNFFCNPTSRTMGVGGELYGLRKDGSEFPVEIGLNPIESPDGLLVLAAIVDITARKQAEKQLQQYTRQLQRRNRDLDQFAHVTSHDLKGQLRGIDNLAQWIHEDAGSQLPEKSAVHLKQLKERAQRLEKLLDDLLDYSSAGRQIGKSEEVSVYELARSAFDLLNCGGKFALKISSNMPNLQTDKASLEKVLRNLLDNAFRHHDRPEGQVEVAVEDAGEFLEIRVSDDGPGIPEEFQGKIFQLFQTLQPRDESGGAGIGLAIVKKTVETFGGSIRLKAVPGMRGAHFCFTWPKGEEVPVNA